MTKECIKCKKLCIRCINFKSNSVLGHTCRAYSKEEMDCVTGNVNTVYALCSIKNKMGNCVKWKLDGAKDEKTRLVALLYSYSHRHFSGCSEHADIKETLVSALLYELEDSNYGRKFFITFEFDSDGTVCYKYNEHGCETDYYKKWKKRNEPESDED